MLRSTKYEGVYRSDGKILTKNLAPGFSVYGEKLFTIEGEEYRVWDRERSKLAAAIDKGLRFLPLNRGSTVLYLGAASGTTASHVSDIVGKEGKVFALDVAPRVVKELIFCCKKKENMFPLLKDASKPDSYEALVPKVDFVYQDIASRDQVDILKKNCKVFLKPKGYALIMVKASSIDSSLRSERVFGQVREELQEDFRIEQRIRLEPYHEKHKAYLVRRA